jgi:hypothetical protein
MPGAASAHKVVGEVRHNNHIRKVSPMKKTLLAAVALMGVAATVFAVSAWAMPDQTRANGAKPHVQHLAFTIVSMGHGTVGDEVAPAASFAVAPGVPVRVTVTNATHQTHTFTAPGLHVNVPIRAMRGNTPAKTSFTFVAYEGGVFVWHCVVCVAQHHRHVMAGKIYAIVDPSVVP